MFRDRVFQDSLNSCEFYSVFPAYWDKDYKDVIYGGGRRQSGGRSLKDIILPILHISRLFLFMAKGQHKHSPHYILWNQLLKGF